MTPRHQHDKEIHAAIALLFGLGEPTLAQWQTKHGRDRCRSCNGRVSAMIELIIVLAVASFVMALSM